MSPKFGLTCDNLVSADLLTANGRLMHVSDETNPELMWALRGAGANFGVVTSFEFRVHPMPPLILAGMLVVPNDERAGTVVRGYRDYVEQAPEDLVTALVTLLAPPADFVPAELVGRPVLTIVAASFVDDLAEGERLIAPLRQLTEDGTAACNRAATYMAHPIACWQHPVETDREMKWVARFSAFEPVLAGGVYLNFEPETQEAVVRAGFGDDKYERLAALKEQYDPENVFRGNHNVVPRTSSVIHPRSGDGGSRVT